MDYKQKYEEALERAKAAHNSAKSDKENGDTDKITEYTIQLTETIFPELAQSEDEKIREIILLTIKSQGFISDEETLQQCVAWLEKQGEQKPTDKVEPKFKVGDWAVNQHGYTRQIIDIKNDCYYCIRTESSDSIENPWYGTINYVDKQWHKWTIQDAKKGDILQVNKCTLILDSLTKDMAGNTVISSWYYCDTETFHCMGTSQPDLWVTEGVVPATEEQRDILFQKMKESGYMWDVEKKELKKISQEYPLTPNECCKPAWGEEDDSNLQGIIDEIEANKHSAPDYDLATYDRFLSWLKSLKERLKGE